MSDDTEYESLGSDNEVSPDRRALNVLLFGESGTGKSAIVNQIFDKNVVESSDQAVGCTIENTKVSGKLKDYPGLTLNLFDTAGLSESDDGSLPAATAFVQLIKLAYTIPNGINLLICCHKKGRIGGEQFKCNYRYFKEELCENRIPCLLVVTHCDEDEPLNKWWMANKDTISKQLKFDFIDGICVSAARNNRNVTRQICDNYLISRSILIESIAKHSLSEPLLIDSFKRKVLYFTRLLFNSIAEWLSWFGVQKASLRPEFERMFIDLKYTPEKAREQTKKLIEELEQNDLMSPYQEINV